MHPILERMIRERTRDAIRERMTDPVRDLDGEVGFVYDRTVVSEIIVAGINVLRLGSLIGNCAGTDDPAENVTSWGSEDGVLYAPGSCQGAPFTWKCRRLDGRTLALAVTVGPLPMAYAALSIPFDVDPAYIDRYVFSEASHEVGCANRWEPRASSGGLYSDIPRWCEIPGVGWVGAARVRGPAAWVEIQGPLAHVRRIIDTRNHVEALAYAHPHTDNAEVGLIPPDGRPAGWTVTHTERLVVTPL